MAIITDPGAGLVGQADAFESRGVWLKEPRAFTAISLDGEVVHPKRDAAIWQTIPVGALGAIGGSLTRIDLINFHDVNPPWMLVAMVESNHG